jgi:hypothetical protein
MRHAICIHLLSVSLLTSGTAGILENPTEPHRGPSESARQPLSAPQPAEEEHATVGGCSGGRSFLLRESEEQPPAVSQKKAVGRVQQSDRASLRSRRSSELPALLWAHTCSVSLSQRHVRLQI